MALDIDTSRAFRAPGELAQLIAAVEAADSSTSEPDWIEWKSEADLSTKRWAAEIAKHICGLANRDPDDAAVNAEGCGYILIGAEAGKITGTTTLDNAAITDALSRYIDARWRPDFVDVAGRQVLALTIEAPRRGDGIAVIHREYSDEIRTVVRDGSIFIRRQGSTQPATSEDIRQLVERARAGASGDPQAGLDWWEHTDPPEFELHPGMDQNPPRLLLQFDMRRGGAGAPLVRWIGDGIKMEPTPPMRGHPHDEREKYQMKAVDKGSGTEVECEITFRWIDGEMHGIRWGWPMHEHEKGHWILDTDKDNIRDPVDRW